MHALQALGPMLLRRQGVVLPLPVKKTQALLLLLTGRAPVPRTEVAALLWPQLDPSTARRNLRRELVRLRDAGAAGLVLAEGDFLALAPATEVDLHTFDAALADGQPEAALALWRGPLAHGLALDDAAPFEDWLAQARTRLQAQRMQAVARLAQALEARQQHAAALQQVELLLADDPLQEQHHCSAMRLLAALGQRSAALQQYERCCRVLADELGLAPMAATRDLAERLRAAAAEATATPVAPVAAEAAPPSPATLPRLLPFVGREAEVQALEAAWSTGGPVLLEGEAGVGKSRLALDFCAAHGPYALVRARPGDAELPYAVFTRGLRALAGSDAALADLPG